MAPPPELSPLQKEMIGRLYAAPPGAAFDRLYLQQQIPAYQTARKINAGFARSGDNPVLRQNAEAAIPVIDRHLVEANQLLRSAR